MRSCLVVDDSPLVRKVASFLVEELDFSVAEAGNATDALAYCRGSMPDVILLDADLPENSAISFMTELRRRAGGAMPVIVICVVEKNMQQITEAGAAGANTYLLKPFDGRTLRAKFAKVGLVGLAA